MIRFQDIWTRAVARKGEAELLERLPATRDAAELAALGEDRYLSEMARCVMASGFRWRVVDAKWPSHEEVFADFDPLTLAAWSPDDVAQAAEDPRVIRHRAKIQSIVDNARFILAVGDQHASFGQWIADWPADDIVGLWAALKKSGARLGGNTGPRVLRRVGKATPILTPDVLAGLVAAGVIDGPNASSKSAQAKVQAAFNAWAEESGHDLGAISVALACTVDPSPG